ncbi:MAG: DUF5681 domain-containing protein [Solimonas sp.]
MTTEKSRRKQRKPGRPWPKGTSGNPKGRPKGSGLSGALRAAIADRADGIVDTLVRAALAGDVQAARVLLDRVVPALKAESLPVVLPGMEAGSLASRAEKALAAAGAGEVSPDVAAALIAAVGALARVKEVDDIEARLRALEARS